jgi:predicted negative regulator of RcsB-dependent stress response
VISKNISEFSKGKTFAKTAKKFGKKKANKQAVAVAMSEAGKGFDKRKFERAKKKVFKLS